ncbi:cystathionine gamma-lyase [Pseudotabrizicola sp.]|uniref:cystathionine gamma-lyase n=1 Tax=Pseudotabrizicola sp. TaxID=2939647 RepID=UPI00271A0EEE|nr:cystathionine gamma-lyase [Pseudotabrizicola sp.]MDO8881919.1 cystathionine gamma-lyase [Pseudotabrizicola sp.]
MMDTDMQRRLADLLHHRSAGLEKGDPVSLPLTTSTSFHLPEVQGAPYIYARNGTPTWEAVEAQLSLLEDAETVTFPSGMGAISAALFATLTAGDRVILPSDGYYVTRVLSEGFLAPLGVDVVQIRTLDYATADFTGAAVVYLETPSNPGLDVVDIADVCVRAHAAGAIVIVDNTTMTPLMQRPLDLGADLVVAADTKAPAGHSDALFGHVAGRDAKRMARVRDWRRLSGSVPGSMEAWLVHRGLETLEVRLERMCASAAVIADRLQSHSAVLALRYPGLMDDPANALSKRQMQGFGFLIGMTVKDATVAEGFLARCPYLVRSTSFGGTHSAGERRARWGDGVPEGFIRLSIGVEPVEALWAAMRDALN